MKKVRNKNLAMALSAMLGGLSLDQIQALRWADLDIEAGVIRSLRKKTGRRWCGLVKQIRRKYLAGRQHGPVLSSS
jgi:integrase